MYRVFYLRRLLIFVRADHYSSSKASGARRREDESPTGPGLRRVSPGLVHDSRPTRARKAQPHTHYRDFAVAAQGGAGHETLEGGCYGLVVDLRHESKSSSNRSGPSCSCSDSAPASSVGADS